MARLLGISFQPHDDVCEGGAIRWEPNRSRLKVSTLPQIVWDDGTPFREANLWALHRAALGLVSPKTVKSNLSKLLSYANFLEEEQIDFWHFPTRRAEQCLIRYRGHLTDRRNNGEISPSGASHRMRVVVQFYRFLRAEGLIDPALVMWKERRFTISTFDRVGFERTISVNSTDLSIPNRTRKGLTLEDGLLPLSEDGLAELLRIARSSLPHEFFLMLLLGFYCGLRIGTIADLRVGTLVNATPDPMSPCNKFINVGPGACPTVATKFGVNGQISVPEPVFQLILAYAGSVDRSHRQARAPEGRSDLLFITTRGNAYSSQQDDSSAAIRTLTHQVRATAEAAGNAELSRFRFHQTRATFATRLTARLLEEYPVNEVLGFVKRAMLHKDESTTMRYIRFVQQRPIKIAAADAFTREFLGLNNETD
jgi:integrase